MKTCAICGKGTEKPFILTCVGHDESVVFCHDCGHNLVDALNLMSMLEGVVNIARIN